MVEIILVIHLLIALAMIGAVLLQRSEGGALGIGGGGGGAGGLFTARGAGSALTRITAGLAVAFFATSITLTILSVKSSTPKSAFDNVAAPGKPAADGKAKDENAVRLPVLPKAPEADPSKPKVPTN